MPTRRKAETAWTAAVGAFPSVAALNKMIVPFVGGIRLRAGGGIAGRREGCLPGARRRRAKTASWRNRMQAAIYGLAGLELTDDERASSATPTRRLHFVPRNCDNRTVAAADRFAARPDGRDDVPILIDQEGGRVARMRPPEWPAFPAAEAFADLYQLAPSSAIEAARVNARAIGLMLRAVGVNVDCLPMLDVRQPGATDIVGDRALGSEPMQVAALGRAVLDGLASAGVVGVIKHIPGHGRALVDSHHELPVVDRERRRAGRSTSSRSSACAAAPMGMVAHVVYTAWDAGAPGEPVADRDPRYHPRAHRLRRPADDRRHRHGGACRDAGRARRGLRRRRLRRRAALQRRAGRQYRRRERGPAIISRRVPSGWRGRWRHAHRARRHRISPRQSPSATRCWRWPSYPRDNVAAASHSHQL